MSLIPLIHPITRAVRDVRRVPITGAPRRVELTGALAQILQPAAALRWRSTTVSYWTPAMVETVLRGAFWGDLQSQWELFDLMEDTWPRLAKNLGEVKRAVCGRKWTVEPWAEDDAPPTAMAQDRAALVSSAVWRMRPNAAADERDFAGTLFDLLDAWGKGSSVLEILWEQRDAGRLGSIVAPRATIWVGPHQYGLADDGTIKLRTPGEIGNPAFPTSDNLVEFPEHKFLIGLAKARTAHWSGAALIRPLAWWWAASNFSAEWLLNLGQIFGLPIRWAQHDPNASAAQIAQIGDMLENMGSAGWAVFPAGTQLELKEPTKSGESYPQASILDRADKQCDLLILGQTGTSEIGGAGKDAGGSFAATKVHATVRDEVIQAACEWLEGVLNTQLVPAILQLNFGNQDEAPEFCGEPDIAEDELGNANRDAVLLDRGVELPKAWFYQRHGIPLPQPGEEVVSKPEPAAPLGFGIDRPPNRNQDQADDTAEDDDEETQALHAASATDRVINRALEDLSGVEAKWLGGIKPHFMSLMAKAADVGRVSDAELLAAIEQFNRELPELFRTLKPEALEDALYNAMSAGAINGALRGAMDRKVPLASRPSPLASS